MSKRVVRPGPRTFKGFPDDVTCPVCGTNDEGESVLIHIDGTGDGTVVQGQPIHLGCAVASNWNRSVGLLYRPCGLPHPAGARQPRGPSYLTSLSDIVCRTCGTEEGVFLVERADPETSYQCQACSEVRLDGQVDGWIRRLLLTGDPIRKRNSG